MTKHARALFLLLLAPAWAYAAGANRIELLPIAPPTCTSGYGCIYVSNADSLFYTRDAAGLSLKLHAAQSFRTSANCSALSSPAQGDVCYDSGLGVFRFRDGSGWTTAATNGSLYVTLAGTQTITGNKTFSGTETFSGALILPQTAAPAQTAEGSVVWDTNDDLLTVGDGVARKTMVDLAGTQTLTNKTLTAPVLGGTITGTYTLGGTPAFPASGLSGQVAIANGGTGAATTSQSYAFIGPSSGSGAPSFRALVTADLSAALTGSAITFRVDAATPFVANDYWGYSADVSASTTTLVPWVAPCAGSLRNLRVQANSVSAGASVVTVHRSAGGGSISYSNTSITCTASSAKFCSDSSNSYSATAGDLFILRVTGANWIGDGMAASLQFSCSAT